MTLSGIEFEISIIQTRTLLDISHVLPAYQRNCLNRECVHPDWDWQKSVKFSVKLKF